MARTRPTAHASCICGRENILGVGVTVQLRKRNAARTFSRDQSSGLLIQPYIGFDAPTPRLQTIVTTAFRLVFDWRDYLK
jgi:hypothetical protein